MPKVDKIAEKCPVCGRLFAGEGYGAVIAVGDQGGGG